jgi:plasmid stabilization system protein ParE
MYKVARSKLAREDIKSITRYIAKDSPSRAITFTQEMVGNFQNKVSLFPKTGMKCNDFYYTIYQGYYIFYDIYEHKQEILIVRIINSAQYTEYKGFVE